MSKTEWGQATWNLIHVLAAKMREVSPEETESAFAMISTIALKLPCPDCARHSGLLLRRLLSSGKPKTPAEMSRFFWHMHNCVNRRLNKKMFSWNQMERYKLKSTHEALSAYNRAHIRVEGSMRGAPALHTGAWREAPPHKQLAALLRSRAYLFVV